MQASHYAKRNHRGSTLPQPLLAVFASRLAAQVQAPYLLGVARNVTRQLRCLLWGTSPLLPLTRRVEGRSCAADYIQNHSHTGQSRLRKRRFKFELLIH